MGGLFGVGDCKESSYKRLCKRVRFVFLFVLIRYNESHPDMAQYQRDLEKEICESGGGLYLSLTAD